MANSNLPIKPEQIIEIIFRRRWLIIIPFCLAMIAGIYLAITLPRIYEASTLILVQPQKVPTDFVQSIVSEDIGSRINTISQQILSRTNLEKIIKQLDLFSGPGFEEMYIENKVAILKKKINVNVTTSRRRDGPDSFSISFRGKYPDKVMKVVNTLTTYFIDENLRLRENQAIGTSDFLDGELDSMRKRLEEVEEAMKEYRKRFMGELPEQLETNLRILDRLQEQQENRRESLRDARARLTELNREPQGYRVPDGSTPVQTDEETNLEQLNAQLERLLASYTDRHPDVIRLRKTIAEFEKNLEKEGGKLESSNNEISPNRRTATSYSAVETHRREIRTEMMIIEREIVENVKEIKAYEKRVENTPKREQELLSLRRDYQNIQDSYNSLLARKLEAEIAVNMERKQKGEQFRVLDPARLPRIPVEPDMKKLLIFTLAVGFGLGGGIIFLLEFLDSSFKEKEEIESFLELPVLAIVPSIVNPKDLLWRKVNNTFSSVFITIAFLLFVCLVVLTLLGVDQTMELYKKIGSA